MTDDRPFHPKRRLDIRSRGPLSPAQRDEIHRRLAEGEDPRELALEFGVSANTIRRHA